VNRLLLPAVLGALLLGSTALAQDDPPYYQEQRLVVIFYVPQDLVLESWNNQQYDVLDRGLYRFDASRKSQAILTEDNYQDGSGPFVEYGGSMSGTVRPVRGFGDRRDATLRLKITEADLSNDRNILRAADLEIEFRVQLDRNSSSVARYRGQATHNGRSHVNGSMSSAFSGQTGTISVLHTKMTLDNHLPIRRPLEAFPETINAVVRPTPSDEIEAGPFGFTLTRDALNDAGLAYYDSLAHFPMVEEDDYYGHYESSAHRAELVVREDGNAWISLGWGLGGRYHGWSFDYEAVLTADELVQLERDGAVRVTGTASYHYSGEDDQFDIESPAEILLTATPTPAATTAGSSTGSTPGLVGGLRRN
jgi:hypothetical protein